MFQGSKHVPGDSHIRTVEGAGGSRVNGTTGFDRTNYFETLPANQLELGLWLESDRMGYLLDQLDQANLSNQQDVVRNERRQFYCKDYLFRCDSLAHQFSVAISNIVFVATD